MTYLEDGREGEALIELGAQARESLVGEKNIALDFLCYLIDGAGVAQPKGFSSRLE